MNSSMDGLLLIDKPKGWTSFDAVNYVRSVAAKVVGKKPRNVKVGHIGTLDPAATGLLVLCVGKYTKKVPDLIRHDKTYEAEITFGYTSNTGDAEGELVAYGAPGDTPEESAVIATLAKFVGDIEQVPPAFSALKIGGKRAYELARAGKEVKLEPRKIHIYSIDLVSYEWPVLKVTCKVGSGTYIRTLAEDIGSELGVGAYLSGLRRTEIDKWCVDDAVDPKSISIDNITGKLLA